mgnify:CR=1 FL=1
MALSTVAERALASNKSASIIHEDRDSAMDVRIWWLLQKVAYPLSPLEEKILIDQIRAPAGDSECE